MSNQSRYRYFLSLICAFSLSFSLIPLAPSQEGSEQHDAHDQSFDHEAYEKLTTHLKSVLPESFKGDADDFARCFVEDGITTPEQIPQEFMDMIHFFGQKNHDRQLESEGEGTSGGDADGRDPDSDEDSEMVFNNPLGFEFPDDEGEETEYKVGLKFKFLTAAYILWYHLVGVYMRTRIKHVPFVKHASWSEATSSFFASFFENIASKVFSRSTLLSLTDMASKIAATVVACNYEKEKSLPKFERVLIRALMRQQTEGDIQFSPKDAQELSDVVHEASITILGAWNPKIWKDRLPVAADIAMFVAPAALYRSLKKGDVATLSPQKIVDFLKSGYSYDHAQHPDILDDKKFIIHYGQSTMLKDFAPYKQGVLEALKIIFERSLRPLEEKLKKRFGNRVHEIEKKTLGLISCRFLSLLAKEILIPSGVAFLNDKIERDEEKIADSEWKKMLARIIPDYNEFDLGMCARYEKIPVKNKENEKGSIVVYKKYSQREFLKHACARAALEMIGRVGIIQGIDMLAQGRLGISDKAYRFCKFLFSGLVKLGITKKNMSDVISEKMTRYKTSYLARRPGLMQAVITTMSTTRSSHDDQAEMEEIVRELSSTAMLTYELESARALKNNDRCIVLEKQIQDAHENIADYLITKGHFSQFITQMVEHLITNEYAILHEPTKLIGGFLMKQTPWALPWFVKKVARIQ